LFCILALGLGLGGCDKCGNFFGSPQSCKDDTRR